MILFNVSDWSEVFVFWICILLIILPTFTCAISALWLLVSVICRAVGSSQTKTYQPLPTHQHTYEVDAEEVDGDEFAEHLALHHSVSRVVEHQVKLHRPWIEIMTLGVELVFVVATISTYIISLNDVAVGWTSHATIIPWIYTLGLVLLRFRLWNEDEHGFSTIWYHTALIYILNSLYAVIPFRSVIIRQDWTFNGIIIIVRFVIFCLLTLLTLCVRKGNGVVQDITADLEPSREPTASLLSLASFSWVDGLVWKGYWKPLKPENIWNLHNDDLAIVTLSSFRQTKKTASLAWTLSKHFQRDLLIQGLWAALASLFVFAPTLLLKVILEYVATPNETPQNVAWMIVFLLLATSTIVAVGNGQALFIGRRICIRLRAVIIGEVYAKALRRKAAAGSEDIYQRSNDCPSTDDAKFEGQANIGAIINLMAVDSFKVSEVCAYLHFLVAAVPVQVVVAVVLLYQILGWSSIAGIGVMILLMPINYVISNRFSKIQKDIMAKTDERIHITNEVLQNIRIIKYFAWEERFGFVVGDSRTAELKQLRKRYILWAIAATSWYGSPMLITFLSFLCYTVVEKKDLNAPVAFTALSLFNVLRVPLDQLADMITNVLQSKVSVDRVEKFLMEEETEKYHQLNHEGDDPDSPLIGFRNASLSWGSRQQTLSRETNSAFQLQNLNIEFIPGALNVIAGPTGSGKTSLLMALLGEMTKVNGSVHLPGSHSREDLVPDSITGLTQSVAYCAQQPWFVNSTIKENILFASPLDEERYRSVLIACSLEHDMQILDYGDETEVGEKGIALSGGQKQRISLARALYSNSAHLLLDDCLSAVDSHTSKWIYDCCITGPLMQGRTCILVTHNVALCVPQSQKLIVLENGRILIQGDPETVFNSGALGNDELLKARIQSRPLSRIPYRVPSYGGEDLSTHTSDSSKNNQASKVSSVNSRSIQKKEKMPKDEAKTEGGVNWKVYQLYLSAMGTWWYWLAVMGTFAFQQVGAVATSVWIRQWSANYDITAQTSHGNHLNGLQSPSAYNLGCYSRSCLWIWSYLKHSKNVTTKISPRASVNLWHYLGVYALLGLGYTLTSFLREVVVFAGSIKASSDIHQRLLHSTMRANIKFFDSTPLGQIINRFSKDMEAIDQEVAPVALGMVHSLASVIAIVVLITIVTPGFLVAGIVIMALYWLIGVFYLRASRDLKRIESIQRSPLYQHFSETLSGVSTIRAYGDERRFIRDNLTKIDAHNRPFFYLWACNRWLGFRVDIAGAFVSFFAGAFVVMNAGSIDAGLAGLSLTYAITFTDNVLWVVRLYAMNEQNMNSVERIREYLEVEQEAPEIIQDNRPHTNWPEEGAVSFQEYSTRYRSDLDMVLKNVNFAIKPGQKVGIVGRTGAGKSSLALALFRGLEAETGRILIDGIDIATIGLRDLRQSITMVPQDPTLFTGTIRSNLDPFGVYTDKEIYNILKRVQLINEEPEVAAPVVGVDSTINRNIFLDLQTTVSESGLNLSQGQRQLLCLARALLRAPKVLVMDEATGSLDYQTDHKIQITIRQMTATIITVAHRLKSVCDYDTIIVLDQGEVKEHAHPHELLKNEEGVFYSMCQSSGQLETLQNMARIAFEGSQVVVESTMI